MLDNTLVLATGVLTAVTALSASWVTSRGAIRTARVKAQSEALEARHDRLGDSRRASYAVLLNYVIDMRWQLIAAMNFVGAGDAAAADAIMRTRNKMVAELHRHETAVLLEGPRSLNAVASALTHAAVQLMLDMERTLNGPQPSDMETLLAPSMDRLSHATDRFIQSAQDVLGTA
ncbi:hypothetical protein [Streptomyces sp. NBC_01304]|uniref:hypothetical protein n=1 Tax=Streptomyces sp. NBC_01304 TaxID=2903818 RepID=UPI002E10319B|nr:hypothetical protein OG430_42825 [Streptomyces sp. NBC_01304]